MTNTEEDIRISPITDYIPSVEKRLAERGDAPELPITSLPEFNRKVWGLRRGRLLTIGARPGQGKSSFAIQICFDLAKQGKKVLFLSLEMDCEELIERMFCQEFQVDNFDLLTGKFSNHRDRFTKFKDMVSDMPMVLSDSIGKTYSEIEEVLSSQSVQPDVVCLDYINAIKGYGAEQRGIIDEFVRNFREQAIRYNFAAILLCQINRASDAGDDKEPKLHMLKSSGFIEEHSDQVALLFYPYKYTKRVEHENKYTIFLEKNRSGRTGFIDLHFRPQYYRFDDSAPAEVKPVLEVNWSD